MVLQLRMVNVWNGLPGKVVVVGQVDKFISELDCYLDALEIEE